MDASAVVGSLAGVLVGAVITWFVQRDIARRQFENQRRLTESERLVAFRRDPVLALNNALGELIGLAIRELPMRPLGWDEFSLDPDTWPVDWKMKREEQDRLRDTINRLALMSPYPSTVEHAKTVVSCVDAYARAEEALEPFESIGVEDVHEMSPEKQQELRAQSDSASNQFDEARAALRDTAYGMRRHLEGLLSRPESDPS